jgi:hypothetical protein
MAAGLCGSLAHSALMYLKFRMGWLPTFQPYRALQITLSQMVGTEVHPVVPWALSFLNGSTLVSFVFARIHHLLPSSNGIIKGLAFGVLGWLVMGSVFFPLLGMGPFASGIGLGWAPALFSFAMFLTYSVALGIAYSALAAPRR